MKKQIIYISIVLIVVLSGCEKMLDLTPEDKVTGKNFWKNKEEVETSMVGAYGKLQGCLSSFFTWGELRSELVFVAGGSDDNFTNRLEVNNNMITKDNKLCAWGSVYSAINQMNYVIDYAPMVRAVDKSFTETELNYFLGEAKTLRALCYFYLARTFQTFPYVTIASKNDEQSYDYAGILYTQVLDSIVKDLMWSEQYVRKNFDDVNFSTNSLKTRYEKGRITQPAVWALLADVYLTQNKYQQANVYLDKIINDGRFSLMTGPEKWYSIFYPGNSDEAIFELQFAREYTNSGDFIKWFSGRSSVGGNNWYQLQITNRTSSFSYWEGDDWLEPKLDNRGSGSTYIGQLSGIGSQTSSGGAAVWKWIGNRYRGDKEEHYRDGNSNDPNWIFYRLADIYLMKAEALNRMDNMTEARKVIEIIRQRVSASMEDFTYSNVEELEGLILDERARELAFEGKRWFDLVRIARRQNNNTEVISSRYCNAKSRSVVQDGNFKARFVDPLAWFFPIHKDEMEKNLNLEQNPYYK